MPLSTEAKRQLRHRREERRNQLWPDAPALVWNRRQEDGFTTIPRTLALVCTLIKILGKADPTRVYLDLWSRVHDDGFLEVLDDQEFAASCGYQSAARNIRTWREHMQTLVQLGFIRTQPKGTRLHHYVLLIHPHDVVQDLRRERSDVPDWWWTLFEDRLSKIGASLRKEDSAS